MNEYESAMKRGHDALLNDQRFPSWRTQPRRRFLVVALCLGLLAFLAAQPLDNPFLALAGLLTFLATWLMLRLTTRGVADLPDPALDERQVFVRDRSYLHAYRIVGASLAVLVIAAEAWHVITRAPIPADLVTRVCSTFLFLALAAPSCVVAWTETEA